MSVAAFVITAFAVWRVTNLFVAEEGPWDVFGRIRRAAARAGIRLMACFLCVSVWVAIPFALLLTLEWRALIVLIPALSGAAIALERATNRDPDPVWIEGEKE